MDIVEDVLAHYGVPGMKWGVRKKRSSDSGETESVKVKTKPGKGIVSVTGGRNQPVSEDAKKARAAMQLAKASGLDAVPNKDLQAAINRMNLEQNYVKAMSQGGKKKGFGRRFVSDLGDAAQQTVTNLAKEALRNQIEDALKGPGGTHKKTPKKK